MRRESEVDTLPRDFSNLNVLEEASGGDISPTHTAPGVLDVDRHAAGGPKIPPRPTGTPALPPTPLSAPSPVPLRNSTLHSLLSAIQSGPSLQPVSLGNINDNNAARGGQELYENTTHSRGIEEVPYSCSTQSRMQHEAISAICIIVRSRVWRFGVNHVCSHSPL